MHKKYCIQRNHSQVIRKKFLAINLQPKCDKLINFFGCIAIQFAH
jgi:hypothetical protein